jgi:hypothetical protein
MHSAVGGGDEDLLYFARIILFFIIRSREFGCMEFFLVISFLIMGVI